MAAQQTQAQTPAVSGRRVVARREPEKSLFSWRAQGRPFKRRNRDFWVSVFAIAAIGSLILYIIEGVMPVILIIALVFLFYILSTVEPEPVEYSITNKGVKIGGKRTDWVLLTRFWFSRRLESDLLVFEMISLPGRLELVISGKDKAAIKKTVLGYIPEEEAPPTNMDKAADWFSKKLPQ
ncbi:hypothetical protein IID22_05180 [Patescibacteria group bacterium]|nr:hypothetical protein [Patescibacteria group bacterium]